VAIRIPLESIGIKNVCKRERIATPVCRLSGVQSATAEGGS
jgi:hypothetical protein